MTEYFDKINEQIQRVPETGQKISKIEKKFSERFMIFYTES